MAKLNTIKELRDLERSISQRKVWIDHLLDSGITKDVVPYVVATLNEIDRKLNNLADRLEKKEKRESKKGQK